MAVPIPIIDDRKFQDLMAEAISLIPRYNKSWTNYNPSDPGIALLEIFAWVTESVIYRADKITEENYWKYLSLIGETRKQTTLFQQEFSEGDIVVAGGEIRLVAELISDSSMTLLNALERDLERPSIVSGVHPEKCPAPVQIDGKTILNINQEFFAALSIGNMIIADNSEIGIIQSKEDTGSDFTIKMFLPFSPSMSDGEKDITAVFTSIPSVPENYDSTSGAPFNKVRVRGRHVLGDDTDFIRELQTGDIIIAGNDARVISDIKSENGLTVHIPFYEDIDHAVDYFYIRPDKRSGTIITDGTEVIGNDEDEDLDAAKLRAITYVSEAYRAVTVSDYEDFSAKAIKELVGKDEAFRTICFSNSNYEWTAVGTKRPGHITIILVIRFEDQYLKAQEINNEIDEQILETIEQGVDEGLKISISEGFQKGVEMASILVGDGSQIEAIEAATLETLKQLIINHVEVNLDPKRILTTRVHAVFPKFKEVNIKTSLILLKGINEDRAKTEAESMLHQFLDPITGGPQSDGWPLGRSLYCSEVYQILEGINGVDHVHELYISSENNGGSDIRYVNLEENEFFKPECTVTIKRT